MKEAYPVCYVVGCFISQAITNRLACHELEKNHSEAVNVAGRSGVSNAVVGRVDIARRARCPSKHVRCTGTKVGDLGMEFVVYQDVCRLHVLVNDRRIALFMKVCESFCSTNCNVDSLTPCQG